MRNKRKASEVFTTSPYRRRGNRIKQYILDSSEEKESSSDELPEQTQDEEEWEINGILDETESQYLLDWVGPWSPTWEPKNHASEVAVQVWEKKKKKQSAAEKGQALVQLPPVQSHISTFDEPAETPQQDPIVHTPLESPLFVPVDPVSPVSQASNLPTTSGLATETSSQSLAGLRSPSRPHNDTVFESIPRAPIPLEYCLPGEFEDLPSSAPQSVRSLDRVSLRYTENQTRTGRLFEGPELPHRGGNTTVQPTPRTVIPETPSVLLNRPLSQFSRTGFHPGRPGSQQGADSVDLSLNTVSSRPSLTNNNQLAANSSSTANISSIQRLPGSLDRSLSFVPESVPANTFQPLTSQPFNSPAPPSSNSTSLLASIAPSRKYFLSTPTVSSDSIVASRSTIGRAGVVPESSTANIRPLPRQFSATRITMDDSNQPKEGASMSQIMEKYSHLEGSTPQEKLKNAYAKLREKSTVESLQNEASATPSSVGDIEASEPPTVPETVAPLSVRVDKDTSHADTIQEPMVESLEESEPTHVSESIQTIQPSALTIGHTEEKLPGSLNLGPSEFAVPLPMDSRVKDDYERVLSESHDFLERLAELKPQGSEQGQVVSSLQQALERLSNAATHPDINVAQHMKDAESNLEQEAAWADYSSAKFLLLSYLIKAASHHDLHLMIAVRGDKSQNVVERYLTGKGFSYTRPREEMGSGTAVEVSMIKGVLSFGIQTTRSDGIVETYKPPAALIALDSSLDVKNPSVEHMRTTFVRNGHLLPVLRLIVASSSEHVELCFPGPSSPEHISFLLRYSAQLIDIVGDLQDDALGVHEDADEILNCLLSDNFNASWSLPSIEPLREANLSEDSELEEPGQAEAEKEKPAISQAPKRLFTEESSELSSKRPRMDESQDVSQFTASSKDDSQTLDSQIQFLEKNLIKMQTSHAADLKKLRDALAAAESRALKAERDLGMLQHRFEHRKATQHKVEKERDQLLQTKTTIEQRQEKQKDDISKLKDERTQLKQDLEQAREALKSGGGDMAELEKAREEIRRLTKENASLERKADFANKQAEYTREQYQTASNVAAQSGNELRQLREENEALKTKAAGEATRLRELNIQNDEKRHLRRIEELENLLSSREELLHKKEDELREIRKNRPSTRSTSTQPRSPNLNARNLSRPTSPGLNNNNNGSTFPGRGSALRFSSEMSLP
ncbi:class II histone deacetylase complex subunits 2 and 3-domain-containing protein [Aspergillus unguis]